MATVAPMYHWGSLTNLMTFELFRSLAFVLCHTHTHSLTGTLGVTHYSFSLILVTSVIVLMLMVVFMVTTAV